MLDSTVVCRRALGCEWGEGRNSSRVRHSPPTAGEQAAVCTHAPRTNPNKEVVHARTGTGNPFRRAELGRHLWPAAAAMRPAPPDPPLRSSLLSLLTSRRVVSKCLLIYLLTTLTRYSLFKPLPERSSVFYTPLHEIQPASRRRPSAAWAPGPTRAAGAGWRS